MEANTRETDKTITSILKVLTYIITGCPIGLAAISSKCLDLQNCRYSICNINKTQDRKYSLSARQGIMSHSNFDARDHADH